MRQPSRRPRNSAPNSRKHSRLAAGAFISIGLMSGMINILLLTGSFFMLEVYDRVLPSRSVPTLVALAILAAALYSAGRARCPPRARPGAHRQPPRRGAERRVYDDDRAAAAEGRQPRRRPAAAARPRPGAQLPVGLGPDGAVRPALDAVLSRHLLPVPSAASALAALVGAHHPRTLTLLTDVLTRAPTQAATRLGVSRNALADASRRNAEALHGHGHGGPHGRALGRGQRQVLASQRRASDIAGGFGAISKVLRMMLQSAVLGVGAYLVIKQEATAGIIIAGSILSARALAPVELAIANWKGFVAARQGWKRLSELLALFPAAAAADAAAAAAPRASRSRASTVAPPGEQRVVVQDVTFALKAGQGLGIIGPSASGKSLAGARCSSASGRRRAARSGSTAPRSTTGRRRRSASTSATCRRTSSCSPAPWRRTSPASSRSPIRRR